MSATYDKLLDETLMHKHVAGDITGLSSTDEKAKVSANDTTAGYLNGKLVGGNNITLTENTDGGNETLTIATDAIDVAYANGAYANIDKGVTNGDSHDHSGGDGAAITEAAITLTDNTTNDVSITAHGLVPKAPNDTTKFLRGDATWAVPPGSSETASWLPAGSFALAGAGDTVYLGVGYLSFADGSGDEAAACVMVPTGKTGISSIKVYYLNIAINTNVVIGARVQELAPAADVAANDDMTQTERAYATTANNNYIEAITLNADVIDDLAALAAGKILNVEIKRFGASGSDTYGATFYVLGVLITWT